MWDCPVCGERNKSGLLCSNCGFDESFHYKKYCTLVEVDAAQEAIARLYQTGQEYSLKYIFQNPEKLEKYIYFVCQAMNGIPEAQNKLGEFYKNEFSDQTMKERGDFWIQKAAEKEEQESVSAMGPGTEVAGHEAEPAVSSRPVLPQVLIPSFRPVFLEKRGLEQPKGTRVVAAGDNRDSQCNVLDWKDIVEVSAGSNYTVGLRRDGSVIAVGNDKSSPAPPRRSITIPDFLQDRKTTAGNSSKSNWIKKIDWEGITAISAGENHIVGLRKDGSVAIIAKDKEDECEISDWKEITAISAGWGYTAGLRRDGSAVAAGINENGQCEVSAWRDIIAISAGWEHTIGLKKDGRVVAAGDHTLGQCDVSDWSDITALSAGMCYTVGLRENGQVVATGSNRFGQCNVSDWRNIIAISAGKSHTVGIQKI